MKAIFGRLALLVVLPFIGTVGERQADAMNSGTVTGSSQDHPTATKAGSSAAEAQARTYNKTSGSPRSRTYG